MSELFSNMDDLKFNKNVEDLKSIGLKEVEDVEKEYEESKNKLTDLGKTHENTLNRIEEKEKNIENLDKRIKEKREELKKLHMLKSPINKTKLRREFKILNNYKKELTKAKAKDYNTIEILRRNMKEEENKIKRCRSKVKELITGHEEEIKFAKIFKKNENKLQANSKKYDELKKIMDNIKDRNENGTEYDMNMNEALNMLVTESTRSNIKNKVRTVKNKANTIKRTFVMTKNRVVTTKNMAKNAATKAAKSINEKRKAWLEQLEKNAEEADKKNGFGNKRNGPEIENDELGFEYGEDGEEEKTSHSIGNDWSSNIREDDDEWCQ